MSMVTISKREGSPSRRIDMKRNRPGTGEKMNIEEATTLLKDRGVSIMSMVTISKREGSPSRRIDMDERFQRCCFCESCFSFQFYTYFT